MFPGHILMVIVTLLAFLSGTAVDAQVQTPVPVEISKQKMVVGGKIYYMHQVMKGQTLYSISKAYHVTVDQIVHENQIVYNGIKEGQMLRIPGSIVQAATDKTATIQQEKPKDQQSAAGPPVTAQQRTQPPATPATQDERYLYHRVRRGETLSSIAREYGISVRDLKKENKRLLFPNEGDYLMIPRRKINVQQYERITVPLTDTIPVDTVLSDTMAVYEEPEIFTMPINRTEVTRLHGSVKVAVLLPFFLKENSARTYIDSTRKDAQGNKIYREMDKPEGLIYEGSLPFLEAYEGILIAVDSLRSLGLSVELDVYDTGADTVQIKRLLWSDMLSDVDLIIGPVYSYNVEQISVWAAERDIPFVSPVPLHDGNITINKPTMYRVFPSENVTQDIMVNELRSHRESNIVFLYSDSAMYVPATSQLWEKVKSVTNEVTPYGRAQVTPYGRAQMAPYDTAQVTPYGRAQVAPYGRAQVAPYDKAQVTPYDTVHVIPYDTAHVIPYYFTGLSSKRDAYSSVTSFENILDQEKENVIVLASTNTSVVSSAFSTLHSFARKYNIKVIGYPEIRGLETVDLRYYYDLELIIPADSYVDFDSPATQSFSISFMKKFRTEPMAESFAWRGFDIAWYFIGGIATGGREFLLDPGTFNPPLLCLEPDFSRDSRMNGYENSGMFILHYKKDMTIEIKRPWPGPLPATDTYNEQVSYPFSGSSRHNQVR